MCDGERCASTCSQGGGGPASTQLSHRTNLHELLGADIVSVHQECLVVFLQVTTQLGVILHITPVS
jgi:hypothetical protein